MKSHLSITRAATLAAAFIGVGVLIPTAAYSQKPRANSPQNRYGETQIGYPAPRASRTLPTPKAAPIPARSIAIEPDAATAISQLPSASFPEAATDLPARPPKLLASNGKPRAVKPRLLAGIKPRRKSPRTLRANLRTRKSAPSGYRDYNRVQANLKGIAVDGMSSINYQRLLGQQWAVGVAAQHFQYFTPQGEGNEQGSGIGGKLFTRMKPFRSRRKHEGIFVSLGLGAMQMDWEQTAPLIGGGEQLLRQQGLYSTVSGGVSYQTPIYGSILVEPRLDYVLFNPIDSESSKAVQRIEPTIALGFGF